MGKLIRVVLICYTNDVEKNMHIGEYEGWWMTGTMNEKCLSYCFGRENLFE